MTEDERVYQISLTKIPEIGSILTKLLIEHFGSATAVFKARIKELAAVDGIGEFRAAQIKQYKDHSDSLKELELMEQKKINALFITDELYPKRLRNCADAPLLLFYKGNAMLNHSKVVSIIGTRHHTEYGRWATEQFIKEIQPYDVMIISGLAYGIDAVAHRTALQLQIPTIGVMAHGFQTIYPSVHQTLAKDMMEQGALLTEFNYHELPDRHHFPKRNRIVAGMADATIVMETAIKGGSMITADLAFQYNRDVFALPGRITDIRSRGCLQLITENKAMPLIQTNDFLETMGWLELKKKKSIHKKLFPELSKDEQKIISLLNQKDGLHVDELYLSSGLTSSAIAAALLSLELQNIIMPLPGKRYQLT